MNHIDGLILLIESYLKMCDTRGYHILEVDTKHYGCTVVMGFSTAREAKDQIVGQYERYVTTCEEETGEPPDALYHFFHAIIGDGLETIITYRRPNEGEGNAPIMETKDTLAAS